MHRMFQPVINYHLASQRPVLGEFLCLCGVQLIVLFLPVRSKVGAERRANRVLGCLHVWYCGPSLLELLHNKRGTSGKGCTLQSYAKHIFQGRWVTSLGFILCIVWLSGIALTSKFFPYMPKMMICYLVCPSATHTLLFCCPDLSTHLKCIGVTFTVFKLKVAMSFLFILWNFWMEKCDKFSWFFPVQSVLIIL